MTRTIIALLALVLSGAIFFLYTKPAYDSVQATDAQIATYNQELNEVGQVQSLMQTLNTQYSAISPDNLNRLDELLPSDVDNIGLILDLNNMAARFGMPLQNVEINTPDSSDSSGGSVGAITSTNSALPYDSLTLTFTTVGTYQNFISLMTDLEESLRIVDLVSLDVTAPGASSGAASSVYQYQITVRTYWLTQQ